MEYKGMKEDERLISVTPKMCIRDRVNDVLDMAKLESDTVVFSDESINLDQVCQEITESLSFQAEEKGLHVMGEHDDYRGVYVWSNAVHLKKVLMNLFTNSMKYNKVNGSIYMSMRTIERSEDHMTCEFKIKDNGIGMSEEFIKNELFTPFVQADNSPRSDYNGTGLGMPIVKHLVEKMGGTIIVESKMCIRDSANGDIVNIKRFSAKGKDADLAMTFWIKDTF